MEKLFYDNAENVVKMVVAGPVIYLMVIGYTRLLGKRTTSQLNNFDWIVTVAMGSMVSSVILLKNVPVMDGALAILILMFLQFVFTRLMVRFSFWKKLVRSTPRLLVFQGKFIDESMKKERILEAEVYAAIRQSGVQNIREVYAVVLETNASLSVIGKDVKNSVLALTDVQGLPANIVEESRKILKIK